MNAWKEATSFVKDNLPATIGETFIKKCEEMNLNYNERLLFRLLLSDAFEFELTMAMLKDQVSMSKAAEMSRKPTKVEEIIIVPRAVIFEKISQIIVDKLGCEETEVTDKAVFTDDLGADSLDAVELLMEFEKEFNTAIPDEVAENVRTVGDAVDLLYKLLNKC
jgi:acyl carrier protein